MSLEDALAARSGGQCEFCSASDGLAALEPGPTADATDETAVWACATCRAQIAGEAPLDAHHWLCLNESAWSQTAAIQVVAWRILGRLSAEAEDAGWAVDLRDQLYLDEPTLVWAQAGSGAAEQSGSAHRDSNGAELTQGDTVTLIKDLPVKGAGFTAKRGTAVRGIALVADNPAQIEGRVNGQRIVILTEFVKKSG